MSDAGVGEEVEVPDDWRVNFARPYGCLCAERQSLPSTSAEAETLAWEGDLSETLNTYDPYPHNVFSAGRAGP